MPLDVVTLTSTVPAGPAGSTAVTWVAEMAEMVAAADPKSTAVASRNPVPVMVTVVPPLSGPATGLTALTVGAA